MKLKDLVKRQPPLTPKGKWTIAVNLLLSIGAMAAHFYFFHMLHNTEYPLTGYLIFLGVLLYGMISPLMIRRRYSVTA